MSWGLCGGAWWYPNWTRVAVLVSLRWKFLAAHLKASKVPYSPAGIIICSGGGSITGKPPPPPRLRGVHVGTFEALKCAARNFHRKENNTAALVPLGYRHAPLQTPQDMDMDMETATPSSGVLKRRFRTKFT
nr:zinc-finger homeodomain protein 1-like isoform X2 [Ipomoea batatas]